LERYFTNPTYKNKGIQNFGITLRTTETIEIENFETKNGTRKKTAKKNKKI
jgi:hypothetical protein